jgi:hypothetical protein
MISFFQLPRGVLKRLDYFRSRFFWQGDSGKRKYRLAKWSVVCCPKDQGGLGIQDLEIKNRALLGKWLFKLLTEDGIWQTPSLGESSSAQMWCLRFLGNPGTHIFGRVLWRRRNYSFHTDLSPLRMDRRLDSRRINNGYAMPLSKNNIWHCTILCGTRVIHSLRCWKHLHRMCRSDGASLGQDKYHGIPCYDI